MINESHRALPAKGAASPRSAYIPAPSIIPIPDTVTSKSPNLRFKDLIYPPSCNNLILWLNALKKIINLFIINIIINFCIT